MKAVDADPYLLVSYRIDLHRPFIPYSLQWHIALGIKPERILVILHGATEGDVKEALPLFKPFNVEPRILWYGGPQCTCCGSSLPSPLPP